jgi:hypothetical protein
MNRPYSAATHVPLFLFPRMRGKRNSGTLGVAR